MTTELAIPPSATADQLDDLAQIIRAYNEVTQSLQRSHESLKAEVVRLQKELASTDAQLQRSRRLAALGEMAAGMAHEIRNPLAAIRLYAEMQVQDLAKAAVDEGVRQTAAKIASAVKGLDAIVIDMLHFAREITPRSVDVEVEAAFTRALDAAVPLGGTFKIVRPAIPAAAAAAHADPNLLHQALVNLIRNACEAMEGRDGAITLSAGVDPLSADRLVFTVRDCGPGIATEAIDRIFNPFFTTRNTGTGLGLAIVHRIVDAHGGAISVHNDGGAVFEMRLPAKPVSSNSGVTRT